MKRIIFFMGIMISGLHLLAQDQSRDQDRIKERDHLTFRDGAVYQVRDNVETRLQSRLILQDGTEVDPDGTVRKRDRKRKQLKNGECISMNGKRYQNHQRFLERFNGHSQVRTSNSTDL
jgi:ribosome-associated protein YbcJ (S4-like RNA binding protein)